MTYKLINLLTDCHSLTYSLDQIINSAMYVVVLSEPMTSPLSVFFLFKHILLPKFALREKKTHREGSLRNNVELKN